MLKWSAQNPVLLVSILQSGSIIAGPTKYLRESSSALIRIYKADIHCPDKASFIGMVYILSFISLNLLISKVKDLANVYRITQLEN